LEIKFRFEILKPVDYVEIGLIIKSLDGSPISAVTSGDSGGVVLEAPMVGRIYSVVANVPECRWVPRIYLLMAGARCGPNGTERG
jgi:hypothetical protein